ncbi:hypothetical protein AHAS_Ahas06G0143300 [Arachis hypogaea]
MVTQHFLWCEHCEYHLKKISTWNPMEEDMVSADPIEFHSEEQFYKKMYGLLLKRIGLTEFMEDSMGSVLVCASERAHMQEGSLSITLFYVSILISLTTGRVTTSFTMLGIIIVHPDN